MNQQEPVQPERNAQAARREFQSPTRNILLRAETCAVVWGVFAGLVTAHIFTGLDFLLFAVGILAILLGIWGLTRWLIRRTRGHETFRS